MGVKWLFTTLSYVDATVTIASYKDIQTPVHANLKHLIMPLSAA